MQLTTPRLWPRKKQRFSGGFRGASALESEVTQSVEFDAVIDEIRVCTVLCQQIYTENPKSIAPTCKNQRTCNALDTAAAGGPECPL